MTVLVVVERFLCSTPPHEHNVEFEAMTVYTVGFGS